jgi:hypothetical protein
MTSRLKFFSENNRGSKGSVAKGMNFRYPGVLYLVSYKASASTNDYSDTDYVTVIVLLLFSHGKVSIVV